MIGLLGKKIGMTHIFDESGRTQPVTLIEAGPCYVVQEKTKETDGYTARQVGFDEKKARLVKKVDAGRFKKAGINALRFVRELRISDVSPYKVGQKIEADLFAKGDFVDVVGTSIRGFPSSSYSTYLIISPVKSNGPKHNQSYYLWPYHLAHTIFPAPTTN